MARRMGNAVKTCEEIKNLKKYDLFDNYSEVFSEQYEIRKSIFSLFNLIPVIPNFLLICYGI